MKPPMGERCTIGANNVLHVSLHVSLHFVPSAYRKQRWPEDLRHIGMKRIVKTKKNVRLRDEARKNDETHLSPQFGDLQRHQQKRNVTTE